MEESQTRSILAVLQTRCLGLRAQRSTLRPVLIIRLLPIFAVGYLPLIYSVVNAIGRLLRKTDLHFSLYKI